jgi:hypothetical protein
MLDSFDRTIARQIESWLRELAADLASALARHLNCQHGAGWYNDMEVGAPLWPNGASTDDRVDTFLDDLLGIAYETAMLEAASFADRYLAIVRDAAYAVVAACGVAVVAIADTCDTLYTPCAVFGPMFEDRSNEPHFPAQAGDQWRNAAAHTTRHIIQRPKSAQTGAKPSTVIADRRSGR